MRKKISQRLIFFTTLFSLCFVAGCAHSNIEAQGDEPEQNEEFEVHQLYLGTDGDCSLIKYGNTDILIDAGGDSSSGQYIKKNLDAYVKDGYLDYVIFTHADNDHVANSHTILSSWLDEKADRKIGLLVDFDIGKDETNYHPLKEKLFTYSDDGSAYIKYLAFRTAKILNGKIERYVPASMLVYQKRNVALSNITKVLPSTNKSLDEIGDEYELSLNPTGKYKLAKDSTKASIKFLYNHFYDHVVSGKDSSSNPEAADKNVISVCTMLKLKTGDSFKRMLFCGDLEEYDSSKGYKRIVSSTGEMGGESMLIKYNKEEFGEPITYYKASHHGSLTSNDGAFLEKIRPQYIGINALAGGLRFKFPREKPLLEMSRWTDRIYITDYYDETKEQVLPYFGNIVFKMNENSNEVTFQNPEDLTKWDRPQSLFTDTTWMRSNRSYNVSVMNLTVSGREAISLAYIKLGHIDIILSPGAQYINNITSEQKSELKDKISCLCNDGVLEYLILPSLSERAINLLPTVLEANGIKNIENVIYHASTNSNADVQNQRRFIEDNVSSCNKINQSNFKSFDKVGTKYLIDGSTDYTLDFYGDVSSKVSSPYPSFYTVFKAEGYRYLHTGSNFLYDQIDTIPEELEGNINTIQLADYGKFTNHKKEEQCSPYYFIDNLYSVYKKSTDTNLMLNATLYRDGKMIRSNRENEDGVYLIQSGVFCTTNLSVTKVLDGSGQLLKLESSNNNQVDVNGDIIVLVKIMNGIEQVRQTKYASREQSSISICSNTSDRSGNSNDDYIAFDFSTIYEILRSGYTK